MSSNFWTKLQDQEDTIVRSVKSSLNQLLRMDPNLGTIDHHSDDFTKKSNQLEQYLTNLAKGILANIIQNFKTTFPFPPTICVKIMGWKMSEGVWRINLDHLDITLSYA